MTDYYDVGHRVGAVAVADFNGDTIPDIAASVQASYPRILVGDGTGQFTLAPDQNQSYGSGTPSGGMTTGDFNGDHNIDLYMLESTQAYQFGQPFILFGSGNDTFATPLPISSGPAFVGDLNGDGRSDMVALANGTIVAFLGQKNETFTEVSTPLVHATFAIAALGDVNRDGKLDLLTSEYPAIRIWLGNGDGTFTQSSLLNAPPEQLNLQSAAIADLDGDGKADIVVVSYPDQQGLPYPLLIYYGNGDGTFQDGVLLPVSHSYTQLVISDINGDSKPDLVLSDGNGIAVIDNLGGRNFGPEEHYVAGQQISGLTVADVNKDGFPDIVAANGNGTTVTVLLNQPNGNPIDGAPSNGVFTISPEPAQYGQPVTLSITMSSPSGPVPTGSVSFNVDGAFIAAAGLTTGTAKYTFNGLLETGSHTFVATYDGDKTYAPESFATLHQVTHPIYATTTVLVANPTAALTSQTVSLTATVRSMVHVPNGTVTFLDGTNSLGSRTIMPYGGQTVILDTNLLAAGTHTLTAAYQGWQDPFNEQAVYEPSTSAPVTVNVNSAPTSTTLQASTTTPTAGTVVTFTAQVISNSGAPFGGATFYDGTAALGTSSLQADGSCTLSTATLAVGTHNITAAFNANATFAGSASPVVVMTVIAAEDGLTTTAVAVAASASGDRSVLVANVAGPSGTPVGEVIFLDGGSILGSAFTDASGTASLTLPTLAAGIHNIFASYAGTAQFAPGVSPPLLEQIPAGGGDFALRTFTTAADLTWGSADVQFTVVPIAGFQRLVQLSCADGVPEGYQCSFSPTALYSGNSYLQLQRLTKPGPRQTSALGYGAAAGILSFLLIGTVGRHRVHWIGLLLMCMSLAVFPSCGISSTSSAKPQMIVLSSRATAGDGRNAIVHTVQILVTLRQSN